MSSIKYTEDYENFYRVNTQDRGLIIKNIPNNIIQSYPYPIYGGYNNLTKNGIIKLVASEVDNIRHMYQPEEVFKTLYFVSDVNVLINYKLEFRYSHSFTTNGHNYIDVWVKITKPDGTIGRSMYGLLGHYVQDSYLHRDYNIVLMYSEDGFNYKLTDTGLENYKMYGFNLLQERYNNNIDNMGLITSSNLWYEIDNYQTSSDPTNPQYNMVYEDYTFFYGEVDENNPWGVDSKPSGGNGQFLVTNDEVDKPTVEYEYLGSGLLALYSMTKTQLDELADKLFTPDFLTTLSKFLLDPFDYLISLDYLPFTVEGSNQEVKYGYLSTGVMADKLLSNFITFDFGSIDIDEYWGGFLDYAPNTHMELYLPFKGFVSLNVDEIMDCALNVTYNIDLFTGTGVAILTVTRETVKQVIGIYDVDVAMRFPITGQNYTQLISSIIKGVGEIAHSAGSGNALAVGGAIASTGASVLSSAKPQVQKSGSVGSNRGFLSVMYPFLQVSRPIQCRPTSYSDLVGYTSETYQYFNELTGFTVVRNTQLKGMGCLDSEREEIENLLKMGVIF